MTKEIGSPATRYSVYRFKDGHLFVYDPSIQPKRILRQFYDIQEKRMRGFDLRFIKSFPNIAGKLKRFAVECYTKWSKTGCGDYDSIILDNLISELDIVETKIEKKPLQSISQPSIPIKKFRKAIPDTYPISVNDKLEIKQFCEERKIVNLCHFTKINHLASILKTGLIGYHQFSTLPDEFLPKVNDQKRIDGHPEAVCLSISYPNYTMFYKYSHTNRSNWVVLLLSANLLWELDCAFCRENAASNNVRHIALDERKKANAFRSMFYDMDNINRDDLSIPDWFPTSPQAEVLVLETIQSKYVTEVHFLNKDTHDTWCQQYGNSYPQDFIISQDYFTFRCDSKFWKNLTSDNMNITGETEDVFGSTPR